MKGYAAVLLVLLVGGQALAQTCPFGDPKPCPEGCCGGGGGAPPPGPPPPGSPPAPPPPPPPGNPPKGPKSGLSGEPVLMETQTSFQTSRDFTINTSLGPVAFTRFFVSDPKQWWYWSLADTSVMERVPRPFGTGREQTTNGPTGLRWWHSFFTMVHPVNDAINGSQIWVRDMDGSQSEFATTATSPKWCPSANQSPSARTRLKRMSATSYEFYKDDGTTLIYDKLFTAAGNNKKYYFLGKKLAANGRPLFDITYGPPLDASGADLSVGGTPCTDAPNGSGVPYIRTVNLTPNGATYSGQLKFVYVKLGRQLGTGLDCVVSAIKWVPQGAGAEVTLASYLYNANKSGDVSLFTDSSGAQREFYGYDAGVSSAAKFEVRRSDLTVTYHSMNINGAVSGTSGDGPPSTVTNTTLGTSTCLPATCCNNGFPLRTFDSNSVNAGDGTAAVATVSHKFYYNLSTDYFQHGEFIHKTDDVYVPATAGAGGPTKWYLTTLDGGSSLPSDGANTCSGASGRPGVIWAVEDKRGNFTVTPHRKGDAGIGIASLELAKEILGASDRLGAGGLQTKDFTYTYGDGGVQRIGDVIRPSALAGGGTTTTRTYFEDAGIGTTASRVSGVITEGKTLPYNYPTSPMETRYRAVFYKTARTCDPSGTDQVLGRVTRVEGPCFVAGWNATGCDATVSTSFPVTEYVYYPDTTNGNSRGRVRYVRTYPNNTTSSCGTGVLETEYVSYDPFGMPLEVHHPNFASNPNDKTVFTYENDRVKTRTTYPGGSSATTTWNYESGILTSVQYPNPNTFEVFCYRTGLAGDACTGGTFSRSLQWKARASTATGSVWTEKVKYEYHPDFALKRESNWTFGDAAPRFEKTYDNDADYRPTWEQEGTGSTVVGTRAFDAMNNLTRLGPPANAPTPFCATNPYACRWMTYDRANRLVQLDSYPSTGGAAGDVRTCLDYDQQGNVRRVAAGCDYVASDCAINHSNGPTQTCSLAPIDYDVDDFGNTVAVKFPWTNKTTNVGVTRYEFDALGNVVRKQTEQMRNDNKYLEYTFDAMGRLTAATRKGGGDITLFTLGYDSVASYPSNCPALSNLKGRLARRYDSFGYTYYSYDEEGRVTKEARQRDPLVNTNCTAPSTAHTQVSPHTFYTWDKDGNLTGIEYPRGRTVKYTYAAGTDRVASIQRNYFDGVGWTAVPNDVIDSVAWEPYGRLRGYRISSAGAWVEYFKGGSPEATPSYASCDSLAIPSGGHDRSNRINGVFVSTGSAGIGSPDGLIFKQVYKWASDQLVNQYTCHQLVDFDSTVVADTFSYDGTQRLLSEASTAAAGYGETFAYAPSGSRTQSTMTGPGCFTQSVPKSAASWQRDLLEWTGWGLTHTATPCNGANGKYVYSYDLDGRRTQKADVSNNYVLDHAYAQGALGAGLDSVYGSATLTGFSNLAGSYSYLYDAFGRRRAKTTPWSSTDESFHDLGHQLLNDTGGNAVPGQPITEFPSDDFVWLDGRVVDILRQKFSTAWAPTAEGYYQCNRNGQNSACGDHFPVSDYLGKTVVVLSYWGGTAGIGRYEAFGSVNKRESRAASPHGVSGSTTVMTVNEDMPPNFDGEARVLLNKSDWSKFSSLTFNGVGQPFSSLTPRAHVWTTQEYRASTGWSLVFDSTVTPYGVDVEAYDFKFKQQGVWWFWTPLRFPGQYYDEETELHENWNRAYDPQVGRYLQPEPVLAPLVPVSLGALNRPRVGMLSTSSNSGVLGPTARLLRGARDGRFPEGFAYAHNNPNAFVDPDGRNAALFLGVGAGVVLLVYFEMVMHCANQCENDPGNGCPPGPGGDTRSRCISWCTGNWPVWKPGTQPPEPFKFNPRTTPDSPSKYDIPP